MRLTEFRSPPAPQPLQASQGARGNRVAGPRGTKLDWERDPLTGPLLRCCQCRAGDEGILTLLGTMMILLNASFPIMYSIWLMYDPSFVFWHSTYLPGWLLFICLFTILLFFAGLNIFWNSARETARTDSTMVLWVSTFTAMLGLGMVYCALPLWRETAVVAGEIRSSCNFNTEAERLVNYEQVLHQIRAQPECAKERSVENCQGFSPNEYTDYLKYLELEFGCSGLCPASLERFAISDPAAGPAAAAPAPAVAAAAPAATAPAPAPSLLETRITTEEEEMEMAKPKALLTRADAKKRRLLQNAAARHGNGTHDEHKHKHPAALLKRESETHAWTHTHHQHYRHRNPAAAGVAVPGPPPLIPGLFSKNAHRWGCSDFVAGQLTNIGGGAGGQVFWQGLALLGVGIIVGFLKLVNVCVFHEDEDLEQDIHDLHYYAKGSGEEETPRPPTFRPTGNQGPVQAVGGPTLPQNARRIN